MQAAITLGLGLLIDLLALRVTIPLWRDLVHNQVAEQLTDAEWSHAVALLLLDTAGAAAIIGGLGIIAASMCVGYVSRFLKN